MLRQAIAHLSMTWTREAPTMIRLTAVLRRNPALTAEEFHTHWRDVHAPKILSVPAARDRVVRYEQHPRVAGDDAAWTGSAGFDGITVQWYRSLDDLMAMIADPEYQRTIAPDEAYLLDLANSVFLLTEEPRVIIDGDVGGSGSAASAAGSAG
jgi:EthD domain